MSLTEDITSMSSNTLSPAPSKPGKWLKQEHDDLASVLALSPPQEKWTVICSKHNLLGYNRSHDACKQYWKHYTKSLKFVQNLMDAEDDIIKVGDKDKKEASQGLNHVVCFQTNPHCLLCSF